MHCSAYLGLQLNWLTSLTPTFKLDSDEFSAAVLQKGQRVQHVYILRKARVGKGGTGDSNKGDEDMREEDTHRESVSVYAWPLLR